MLITPESLVILGGALALALGLAGSAIGMGIAGSAGAATLSEEPGQLRNVIVLVSLPMTQTFYGLILLILFLTNVLPTVEALEVKAGMGFAALACGLIGGLAQLASAAYQGGVCASGISLLARTRGRILTNAMMLAVFVELLGVLGLVFTIMALNLLGLF
jgi:V/A-type H+/Na+-transporting ATPase subunit K